MKSWTKTLLAVIVVSIISILLFTVIEKIIKNSANDKKLANLPAFSFLKMDGSIYSDLDIINKDSVIINYFSPDCDHCQYMTKQIVTHSHSFSRYSIIMVTAAGKQITDQFITDYHLKDQQNMVVLRDTSGNFYKVFGMTKTPSFFIYKQKRLVKKIIGETSLSNLISDSK